MPSDARAGKDVSRIIGHNPLKIIPVTSSRKKGSGTRRRLVYGGLAALALWGGSVWASDFNRWELAPTVKYTVQSGDTLYDIAVGENLRGGEIGRYVRAAISDNNFYVPAAGPASTSYRRLIDDKGRIYAGDKILLRDIDRDGKVSPKKK